MNRSHADRLVPTRTAAQLLVAAARWSQIAPANHEAAAPVAPKAQPAAVAALLSNYAE